MQTLGVWIGAAPLGDLPAATQHDAASHQQPQQKPVSPRTDPTADLLVMDEGGAHGKCFIAGIDMESGYGRAGQAACLEGVVEKIPKLAPLLATQWHNLVT